MTEGASAELGARAAQLGEELERRTEEERRLQVLPACNRYFVFGPFLCLPDLKLLFCVQQCPEVLSDCLAKGRLTLTAGLIKRKPQDTSQQDGPAF